MKKAIILFNLGGPDSLDAVEPFLFNLFTMALYYDLPVFKDVYKLILLIFERTTNFSREYKYTLGQDMKRF